MAEYIANKEDANELKDAKIKADGDKVILESDKPLCPDKFKQVEQINE